MYTQNIRVLQLRNCIALVSVLKTGWISRRVQIVVCRYLFTSPLCRSRTQVYVGPSVKFPELLSLRKRNLYNLKTKFLHT